MKKPEVVMEILEAYDLTGSFRAAAGLVGCDHKTVAYWVRQRDEAGGMPVVERSRPAMEAVFAEKIDELVDRSHGQIRADAAHGKLVAIGYLGLPADDAPVGCCVQAAVASQAWSADAAVDPGAGVVDAVGLRRRADGRGSCNGAVLRVAGMVTVPGRGAVAR